MMPSPCLPTRALLAVLQSHTSFLQSSEGVGQGHCLVRQESQRLHSAPDGSPWLLYSWWKLSTSFLGPSESWCSHTTRCPVTVTVRGTDHSMQQREVALREQPRTAERCLEEPCSPLCCWKGHIIPQKGQGPLLGGNCGHTVSPQLLRGGRQEVFPRVGKPSGCQLEGRNVLS